jgi:hypothetical protein
MSALDSAGRSATGSAGYPAHSGVDEQGAEADGSRYLTFQDIDMVDQITPVEPGVGQHHDGVQNMIILKNRQGYSLLNNPGATRNNRQKPWRCLCRTIRSDSRASRTPAMQNRIRRRTRRYFTYLVSDRRVRLPELQFKITFRPPSPPRYQKRPMTVPALLHAVLLPFRHLYHCGHTNNQRL